MLLDRLGDTLAGVRSAAGAATQREQNAIRRVNALADRLERMAAARQSNPALETRLKQDLDRAIAEARDAAEAVRRASPRYGDLVEPAPMAEAGIRKLLQPGEVLLSYSLGKESSFVWMVTPSNIHMRKLLSRSQIEQAASAFTRAIATRQADWQPAAATLEKLILPLLPSRATRVIVTPDGGLEAVPFAALPTLSANNLETATLPSASALALLRSQSSSRREPRSQQQQAVLALGDPVLSAADSRNPNPPAARDQQPNSLARLRFSRIEVDAIAALLPMGQVRKALDFDAARSTLFSNAARNAAIVHLAAHAIVDPVRPELSRLVLSAIDSRGAAVDPSIRLHEIYNLELPQTRLVTLSACRSAIGTSLPGEGLVSLTRGFQYAGAASVLATLWDVEDRSTSRWMESFYRNLLVQRRPPAAAVRDAMRIIRSNPETAHPFYWSGFVLQGEWR
jgi:CHAT domain-containing protein